jgi:hypothetical protein
MDRFVQSLYDHAKTNCINGLYSASRALRFWTLADYDVFGDVLKCSGPTDVNYLAVASGHDGILTHRVGQVNKLVTDLAPRSDPVIVVFHTKTHPKIIPSFKKDRGIDEDLDDQARYWEFTLDPATKESTSADSPFAGMSNVRLTEVRCWLIGLDSAADATGHIKVNLTQMGEETIVAPNGESIPITHDPVPKAFEYSIKKTVPSPEGVVRARGHPCPAMRRRHWGRDTHLLLGLVPYLPGVFEWRAA